MSAPPQPRAECGRFDPAGGESARAYARIRYRLFLVDLALSMLFLGALQASGFSSSIAQWWSQRVTWNLLAILGDLAVFGGLYYLAMLPLHFYSSFLLERRFHLSRMTLTAWSIREVKQLAVSGVLGALVAEGLYALLRHAPTHWPIWATLGWVLVSVVMARIFPTVVLPIFYKTRRLEDEGLVQRLLALCQRVGLAAIGVFRVELGVETRKANAALVGVGRSRRVLLSDTLLSTFTPEEIETVLAHELAHHRYRHIPKLLLFSAAGSWVAFQLTRLVGSSWVHALGLRGLSDIAGFPILMLWLSVVGLIGQPIQHALSRSLEWQADRFAVDVTKRPRAFADALRRLAALNLADPAPPRWVVWLLYDHPPITERIRVAEQQA
ncbi:MAG: M48 family metallopeptidase [Candidatus Omnitrophica bacterium]|nr:M48 family metallopeptidase [Candidatus Omnitrophota bacterium]